MVKSGKVTTPYSLARIIAACLVVPAAPAAAQEVAAAATQAAAAVDAGSDTGDIVVTARRREESILDTPISVTALTSEDIEKQGITTLNDLARATPSVNILNFSSGRNDRSFQQISMRGFVPTTANATLVSAFIDGVPVASTTALNAISDPERIEILKGPQAAYFGRNTFAGAINVVNKEPGRDFGGTVSASYGTRNYYDIQGSLEAPIVDDMLAFRITGRAWAKDGSYRNGANPNQTLGDQSSRVGTALIVAKPVDGLRIKLFGLLSTDNDGPSANGALFAYEVRSNNGAINIPRLTGSNAGTVIVPSSSTCELTGLAAGLSASEASVTRPYFCGAAPSLPPGFPQINTIEDRLLAASLANGANRYITPNQGTDGYGLYRRFYHLHANIDYEVGDTGVTLSSLTGLNSEKYSALADLDNFDGTSIRNPANPTNANVNLRTFYDFPFLVERGTRDFSQEFRASYDNGGRLTAMVGASYLLTKVDSDLVNVQNEIVNGIATRASSSRSAPQKAKTYGLFFGLTYQVLESLKLSLEGRYQSDRIYAITGGNTVGLTIQPNNQFGLPSGSYGPLEVFFSKKYTEFLPRAIVQYDIDRDVMVYASYSEGANIPAASFNTNFLNGSPTVRAAADSIGLGVIVNPEKLKHYEIGLKGRFFNNRLTAQLAAYYADWTDQHNIRSITLIDEAPPRGTGGQVIVSGTANSGNSIVKGIELELVGRLFDGLTVNTAFALNDTEIKSFADPSISRITGVIGEEFRGNQLPNVSKYAANLGVQYGTDIGGWDEGSWFIRGDLSYKSKIYANAANLYWIRSRTQVNFRAGVTRGAFSLEAFVNNAFNNRRYVGILDQTQIVPGPPFIVGNSYLGVGLPELRTAGLKASFRY